MSNLINSILNKDFVDADSVLSEKVELIMARKLEEAKKMCAAKMTEQQGHVMNRTAAKLRSMEIAEEEIDESVSVKKKDYSWGKMITVHHGNKISYPLHPEHQEKISNLKDDGKVSFKDETGSMVTAHRSGNKVHLSKKGHNEATPVSFDHFSKEQLDEARIKIVKARIRGGKIQRRKKISNVPGMTIRGGKLQRMSPAERRRRKMGARRGKIKRKAKMNRAIMKRQRSIRKRKALGL